MRTLLTLAAALVLAACGGLKSSQPAPVFYRLGAPVLAAGETLPADLLVPRPTAAPGLDSQQIATRWPGLRLDYYADARWGGPLPGMVQAAVIESLQGTRRLRSVQGDLGRFRATHVLDLEVRRLEADYVAGTPPVARVTLAATLGRQSDRRPLATWTIATEAPAAANRLSEVVAALDDAFARAVTELATRSTDAIAADLARQPEGQAAR